MRRIDMVRSWTAALLLSAGPLCAHEFWIEPHVFELPRNAPLVADLRVGSELKGAAHSYNPDRFRRFDLVNGGMEASVPGRLGDRPALDVVPDGDGLTTIVHATTDNLLTYRSWAQFEEFCRHKDFPWALERHVARGLDTEKVRERYSRYAKSLVALGDGRGADVVAGLTTEIVALANPYTDDLSQGFPVRVLYRGAPRADVQVELFERAPDGEVSITLHRTDADGRVALPVKPGHVYLVDSVVMRELEIAEEGDPAWESLWASLTFAVPA
jgi:hypothetical protein